MRTAIIDGDTLAYLAAIRSETTAEFGDQVARVADMGLAQAEVRNQINSIKANADCDEVVIALSDPDRVYWRNQLLPSYKAHRSANHPVALKAIRKWMSAKSNCYIRPLLEADDVVGILGTHPHKIKGTKVIVSIDKDLLQVPGFHYNLGRADDGVTFVTEEEGRRWHLMQTLIGDKTDGYTGCPGVGPKKAAEILKNGTWDEVVTAFTDRGFTEADALLQARVARILQHTDWNFEKKEPRLWEPPQTPSSSKTQASVPSSQPVPSETPKTESPGTT